MDASISFPFLYSRSGRVVEHTMVNLGRQPWSWTLVSFHLDIIQRKRLCTCCSFSFHVSYLWAFSCLQSTWGLILHISLPIFKLFFFFYIGNVCFVYNDFLFQSFTESVIIFICWNHFAVCYHLQLMTVKTNLFSGTEVLNWARSDGSCLFIGIGKGNEFICHYLVVYVVCLSAEVIIKS